MNLKNFKKIHDDEHKAVLRNDKGHSITLAKKGLSKGYLENLGKLPLHAAEGMRVPEEFEPGKDYSQAPLPGDPIASTVASSAVPATPSLSPLQKQYNTEVLATTRQKEYMFGDAGEEPKHIDPDALRKAKSIVSSRESAEKSAGKRKIEALERQNKARSELGLSPKEETPQDVSSENDVLTAPAPTTGRAPTQSGGVPPQVAASPQQDPGLGMQNQMTSRADSMAAAPSERPESPEQYAQTITAEADSEDDKYWADLAHGKIKAKTVADLFEEKSTVGKIGMIFGMLLSGAGSGLSKQPNALMEMMNKELDRDLEAQKDASAKMQNYYKLSIDAELAKVNMTREQAVTAGIWKDVESKAIVNAKNKMMLGVASKLMSDADMLPDGPMKQRAMLENQKVQGAAAQQIKRNNMELGQKLANDPEASFQKRQAGLRAAGTLGLMPGAEALANENEARHIPSIGTFTQAVPQGEKIKMTNQLEFEKAARKYIEFAKKHQMNWANLNPVQRMKIANEGNVLAAELQGKYRIKTQGGVYKESEQDFINKIIPDKAASWQAFFNQVPKVTKAMETNYADLENTAKSYGGSAPRYNPKDGKYYTRGPNGEAVEVK